MCAAACFNYYSGFGMVYSMVWYEWAWSLALRCVYSADYLRCKLETYIRRKAVSADVLTCYLRTAVVVDGSSVFV